MNELKVFLLGYKMADAPPQGGKSLIKDPGFLTGTAALLATGGVFIYTRQKIVGIESNVQNIITNLGGLADLIKQHSTRLNEHASIHKTVNTQVDDLTKRGKKMQRNLTDLTDKVAGQQDLLDSIVAALPEDVRAKLDQPVKKPAAKPQRKSAPKRRQDDDDEDEEEDEEEDSSDVLTRVRRQRTTRD